MRVFAKKEEREGLVKALKEFLPEETEILDEELAPEEEGGVFTQPLISCTASISSQKKIRELLKKIFEGLSDQEKKKLLEEVDERVDAECNFYLRLSKEKLLDDKIVLQYKDPVHVKVKVAAYPAKKENAVEVVRKMMKDDYFFRYS